MVLLHLLCAIAGVVKKSDVCEYNGLRFGAGRPMDTGCRVVYEFTMGFTTIP